MGTDPGAPGPLHVPLAEGVMEHGIGGQNEGNRVAGHAFKIVIIVLFVK